METRRSVIVEAAQLADELGYEVVAVPEGWGLDSTIVLTEIALATSRIRPMSAILSIWGRTAATIAMSSATLLDLSDGRYLLGLGVSTPAIVTGFHDVRYHRPAAELQRVIDEVRSLSAGNRASRSVPGDVRPLRLGLPVPHDLEIIVAAMGPRTRRVAALHGDGWYPVFIARDHFLDQAEELRRIRVDAGLDGDSFVTFSAPGIVAVDDDLDRARAVAASTLAWYVVAMGDNYARLLTEQGFGDEVQAVIAANPRPRPGESVVPAEADRLLDQFTIVATPDCADAVLREWDALGGITSVGIPPALPERLIFDLVRAAAPRLANVQHEVPPSEDI
jgi:alkanesulfonate monooxygenase SsuD/methylene tetrahydromethanopterin reductase-like flavin-dependent oxidoreductase (luciferase family)